VTTFEVLSKVTTEFAYSPVAAFTPVPSPLESRCLMTVFFTGPAKSRLLMVLLRRYEFFRFIDQFLEVRLSS
jgi:hypothetical protein